MCCRGQAAIQQPPLLYGDSGPVSGLQSTSRIPRKSREAFFGEGERANGPSHVLKATGHRSSPLLAWPTSADAARRRGCGPDPHRNSIGTAMPCAAEGSRAAEASSNRDASLAHRSSLIYPLSTSRLPPLPLFSPSPPLHVSVLIPP